MSPVPRISLRPGYEISRVVRGGWQLAGGHGSVDRARAVDDLAAAFDAGITTFDCADIYTGVEELIGDFRAAYVKRRGAAALADLKVHTKFVPDLADLARVDARYVRRIVDRSLQRLRVERLDLVQFHWWDYAVPGAVDAALHLDALRREGKIDRLGGTNFDAPHTAEFLDAGVELIAMQVQYSVLDDRPAGALARLCAERDVHLLCYGTVAGGFLSERWLGAPEPHGPFEHRSLTKYKLVIDDFGGWALFQELLETLRAVARRHESDIAGVATAYVLRRPRVAAAIVGARTAEHVRANATAATVALDAGDVAAIEAVTARRRGPAGDGFALERDRTGRHGRIMKYDLNDARGPKA